MGGNWTTCTVADVAAKTRNAIVGGPFGSDLVSRDYVEVGVPVIRGTNMGDRWVGGEFAFVSPAKSESLAANHAEPGDIVFTQRGTLGQVALVPAGPYPRYLISQSQMKLTVDPEKASPLFLYYVFRSVEQQEYIRKNAIQTGVPHTNLGLLRATPLELPLLSEQVAIARILGALDDKIELNGKMNATLEAMARALFKWWFQEHLEAGGMDEKLVSDLAAVGVLQVGDGYRAKNDEMASEGLPFARAGNIDNGFDFSGADLLGSPGVAKAGDKVSRACDVVFTSKGTVGRFAFVDPAMRAFVYSPQLCFWRSTNHEALNPFVLRQWMGSRWFLDQVDRVKGQTDMAEYVSLRDQRAMRFPLATPGSQAAIGTQLAELQRLVWNNERETHTLAHIRDELLSRLLSGELPVDGAERAVEDVA